MQILVAPTGKIVRGSVMDVNPKSFEQKLKEYDKQLYIKWNPFKVKGLGCWEVRRQPEMKSIVDWAEFEGNCYTRLEYAEVDLIHHVLDCAFLNYDALRKIREMDTWNLRVGKNEVVAQAERNLDYTRNQKREQAKEELRYAIRQHKSEWKALQSEIASGLNPAAIASFWGKRNG